MAIGGPGSTGNSVGRTGRYGGGMGGFTLGIEDGTLGGNSVGRMGRYGGMCGRKRVDVVGLCGSMVQGVVAVGNVVCVLVGIADGVMDGEVFGTDG